MNSNKLDLAALQRNYKQSQQQFTYEQRMRHYVHSHNNDIPSGLLTAVVGAGFGYFACKTLRACGLMIGVGILGLEALGRLGWATVDWQSVTDMVAVKSSALGGTALGPFAWSWSRRGFVAGLLIGFSLENFGRSKISM